MTSKLREDLQKRCLQQGNDIRDAAIAHPEIGWIFTQRSQRSMDARSSRTTPPRRKMTPKGAIAVGTDIEPSRVFT